MTQIETVLYTAKVHTTAQDEVSYSGLVRLHVDLSSPGSPDTRTNSNMTHVSVVSPSSNRRSFLGTSAAAADFGFALLAVPSYAHTKLAGGAESPVASALPGKLRAQRKTT